MQNGPHYEDHFDRLLDSLPKPSQQVYSEDAFGDDRHITRPHRNIR